MMSFGSSYSCGIVEFHFDLGDWVVIIMGRLEAPGRKGRRGRQSLARPLVFL